MCYCQHCRQLLNTQLPDSTALAKYLLSEAGVAITPGNDFGAHLAEQHVRFAYTTDETRLIQAVERIRDALNKLR